MAAEYEATDTPSDHNDSNRTKKGLPAPILIWRNWSLWLTQHDQEF